MDDNVGILLDRNDNVATLCDSVDKNDIVEIISKEGEEVDRVEITTDISLPYHKIALEGLGKGSEIVKYGEVIGKAIQDIERGEWVHTHNVKSLRMEDG